MVDTLQGLVERSDELAMLRASMSQIGGGLVLIEGEPGSGKSELIRAAIADAPSDLGVLVGACEPLVIPAAFAPMYEVLGSLPDELADQIRGGAEGLAVYAAVLDLLRSRRTLLVIDDAQWADTATVGLLRYVGRRINDTPSVLVVAFRSDDVDRSDDIAELITELGARGTRIELGPLSIDGVRALAAGTDLDALTVLRRTGGNPFFVSEVVRSPDTDVPTTIGEAVASRMRRLPIGTQRIVEVIALCPDGLDVDLATGLSADASDHIDLACEAKLLIVADRWVRCPHELVRSSIVAAVPPLRLRQHHQLLAARLEPTCSTPRDIAHLAHHFASAGDAERALDYSIRAARDAVSAGTHRHAADNLTRALTFRDLIPPDDLFEVLGLAIDEFMHVGRYDEAVEMAEQRLALANGDSARADVLAQLGFCWTRIGGCSAGQTYAEQSVALVPASDPRSSPLAHRLLASAAIDGGGWQSAIEHALAAVELARACGDTGIEARALNIAALAKHTIGQAEGFELFEPAHRLAAAHDDHDAAAMALNNIGCAYLSEYRLDAARHAFQRALAYCVPRQLDTWEHSVLGSTALIEVRCGDIDAARRVLTAVAGAPVCRSSQSEAAGVATRILMRSTGRGGEALDELVAMLDHSESHWDHVDQLSVVLEAAWLGACSRETGTAHLLASYERPGFLDDPWACGMVAFWARRIGAPKPDGAPAGPFGLESAGQIEQAAAAWDELGCPYEAALTRAWLPDPPIDTIVVSLEQLEASAAISAIRRDLRDQGINLQEASETEQAHPSGLTRRQLDVLALLAEGCTNADIAARLYISEKTAGHHVSAILGRFGVPTRGAAVALASANGWVAEPTASLPT